MKTINNFKVMALVCGCLGAMTLSGCDDNTGGNDAKLTFNPATATVEVDATATVTVSGGEEPYTVTPANTEIATATVAGSIITISGVAEGPTTITVKDKNNVSATLEVTVEPAVEPASALIFDEDDISMPVANQYEVKILSGTAPFLAESDVEQIATVTVDELSGNKLIVTSHAIGVVSITVTDAEGVTGTISVTVHEMEQGETPSLSFDRPIVEVSHANGSEVKILNGTEPFSVSSGDETKATATLDGRKVIIAGSEVIGSTYISVTDAEGVIGTISVNVVELPKEVAK